MDPTYFYNLLLCNLINPAYLSLNIFGLLINFINLTQSKSELLIYA